MTGAYQYSPVESQRNQLPRQQTDFQDPVYSNYEEYPPEWYDQQQQAFSEPSCTPVDTISTPNVLMMPSASSLSASSPLFSSSSDTTIDNEQT